MTFERKKLSEQHYIYVDREASFSGTEIADAMASGFGEVFGFVEQKGITPLTMPVTVYLKMPDGAKMSFRSGVFVSADAAKLAEGEIKSDVMPAGDVVLTTHVGAYANLNQTHKALWDYMEVQGLPAVMPVWEIYIDDPTTKPESEVRTEIYRAVGI